MAQITRNGNNVKFDQDICKMFDKDNSCVLKVKQVGGVYKVRSDSANSMLSAVGNNDVVTWHRRLGHINYADMCKMRDGVVNGISFAGRADEVNRCEICLKGKQSRQPFPKSNHQRQASILDLIHSDLCGPMETKSIGGARYFFTLIDDHSRMVFVYFLKNKSDVFVTEPNVGREGQMHVVRRWTSKVFLG